MIVLMFLSSMDLIGQPKSRFVMAPDLREEVNRVMMVDTAYLRVSYALNADDLDNPSTYVDWQYLQIGDSVSKYYSKFLNEADSLVSVWLKEHPHADSVPLWLGESGKNADYWTEYQYSELFKTGDMLTVYARMPMYLKRHNCFYVERIPRQQWQLHADTLEIGGYVCQKATCSFRGRSFEAWFAPDISIPEGPWTFGGLPGLILKVYDTDRLYIFECVQIEKGKFPIKKYDDYKEYKPMNKQKVLKLQRKINENYFVVAKLYDYYTNKPKSRFTPYEPLELE